MPGAIKFQGFMRRKKRRAGHAARLTEDFFISKRDFSTLPLSGRPGRQMRQLAEVILPVNVGVRLEPRRERRAADAACV